MIAAFPNSVGNSGGVNKIGLFLPEILCETSSLKDETYFNGEL